MHCNKSVTCTGQSEDPDCCCARKASCVLPRSVLFKLSVSDLLRKNDAFGGIPRDFCIKQLQKYISRVLPAPGHTCCTDCFAIMPRHASCLRGHGPNHCMRQRRCISAGSLTCQFSVIAISDIVKYVDRRSDHSCSPFCKAISFQNHHIQGSYACSL